MAAWTHHQGRGSHQSEEGMEMELDRERTVAWGGAGGAQIRVRVGVGGARIGRRSGLSCGAWLAVRVAGWVGTGG